MTELNPDFQILPDEYQQIIRLAQSQYQVSVAPLQLLVGGWSGAVVYLVSVSFEETGRVEHCILKLDRKGKAAKSDEVTRHNAVIGKSPPAFARDHIAELVFDRVEQEGVIAIFYRIAGQSLLQYRPLSSYEGQSQLTTLFTVTNTILLDEWNASATFRQATSPQKVLESWLGFRLDAGGNIEQFLQTRLPPEIAGFLVNGSVFPNPLHYARTPDAWGRARPIDVLTGFIHGDLNTNNILVKFSAEREGLEGYYLIDFALFKEGLPLLYDQRYLEMSYLMHLMSQVSFAKCVSLLTLMSEADRLDPSQAPIELSGVSAVIASTRTEFAAWVKEKHPSLHDDLWGQYWLAGVAAGLAYCHKAGQPEEQRLAGLIYAAANLKRYLATFHLPPPTDVQLLYDENRTDPGSVAAPKARTSRHNLPAQPTPFIGRTHQIAAVRDLLLNENTHLVTLTGPGGTGKTRLSLRVAEELVDPFPQGVIFVPLADDMDAQQFVSRVAQSLEVREGGRPLLENLKDYLRDKSMLLVLDNFEQLMAAVPILASLLEAAPQLKILTSSRVALNLRGEHIFPIPPLELPHDQNDLTRERLAENEAVLLFLGRAQAIQPSFTLTDDNAPAVAEICRRLDGLPLALELAAARIKLLSPPAILSRLDDRLKLLTSGARDLPSRHQTLRNTLEWSHGLLNEEEKTLYARLSVFVGGFTLEAAEAICNPDGRLDLLELLTSLVNNSLLRQDESSDDEPRFGMLETIRAYALERLTQSGELETLRAAHAHYYGNIILRQAGHGLYTSEALRWLNWLEREIDNVRATFQWSLTADQFPDLGAGLVWNLFWFWYRRGYLSEGRLWTKRVLDSAVLQKDISRSHAMALAGSGFMAMWQGEQEAGLEQIQKSLAIVERLEDEHMMPFLLMGNAVAFINMGRDNLAQPLLSEAITLFKEQKQPYFHTVTMVHLGNVELGLGHSEEASVLHEKARAEAQALGETWLKTFALNNLGEVARTQGHYELARKYYEECEALLRETGDQGDVARFVHSLGYIAQHAGEYGRAESQFRESLKMFRRLGNRRGIAECLVALAGLKARQGDVRWGAQMLAAGEAILQATGGAWWPADRLEVEQNRQLMRASLAAQEFAEAWQTGGAMSIDQAIAFASNEA